MNRTVHRFMSSHIITIRESFLIKKMKIGRRNRIKRKKKKKKIFEEVGSGPYSNVEYWISGS